VNPSTELLAAGAEVLVPAVTWPTQIWSLMMAGLRVRFVDIDPRTLNVDLKDLEQKVGPRTRAISLVHLMGNPNDMTAVADALKNHELIEDYAFHAIRYETRPVRARDGQDVEGLHQVWIWLDNPKQLNAYTTLMVKETILAFQRASVSGDSLRLMATFDSGDLGRPRGLSMVAAVRAPKICGRTSRAGQALASIAVVHSGLSRLVFSGLGRFFIPFHLTFVGFTQTDTRGLPPRGVNTTLCRRSSMKPSTQ